MEVIVLNYKMTTFEFDDFLKNIKGEYKVYAPMLLKGKGTFSDTDTVRYGEVNSISQIEFNKKSNFSPKEVLLPVTETLFYFTEDSITEPKEEINNILVFMRSCDIHAVKRLDEIYLRNGFEDNYYKKRRDKIKFVIMECRESFENCFCVSMGTNDSEDYSMFVKEEDGQVFVQIKDDNFEAFMDSQIKVSDENIKFKAVTSNETTVNIPDDLDVNTFSWEGWKEYSSRCIACGRCNTVCGTCSCFTMQDIFYNDNKNVGERRRVWASCQIDGYTKMAGGHSFRKDHGERMRFKVMHKVYDFKKRYGYHMCVGCGRCDDVCPEYISFSNCINKLNNRDGR
jgi:anaerobic sulfite reductase subunit A